MHAAFQHLAKQVAAVEAALVPVVREVEQQSEREGKRLEQVAYGDEFDEGVAPVQEKVVALLQETLESLDAAEAALVQARQALEEIPRL